MLHLRVMVTLNKHFHSLENLCPFACETERQRNFIMSREQAMPLATTCSDVMTLAAVRAVLASQEGK